MRCWQRTAAHLTPRQLPDSVPADGLDQTGSSGFNSRLRSSTDSSGSLQEWVLGSEREGG